MNTHLEYINQKIEKRKKENAFRELKTNSGLVDFCSNDYLGFASEKQIHQIEGLIKYGSTGSRLISGNEETTENLESYLAKYHQAEAGLIFNSGYTANLGLFSSLPQKGDTIVYDEIIHASIRDGINLSYAHSYSFKHSDLNSLKDKLERAKGKLWVVVESIYSMDGDQAPLEDIISICKENNAALIVDEAHAVGIYGTKGEGLVSHLGLQDDVFARIITFGKALGSHGAIVIGSNVLRSYLINFSRPFIYTTALPVATIHSIKKAYTLLEKSTEKRKELIQLIAYFKEKIQNLEFEVIDSDSAIQCIIISGNQRVKEIAEGIQRNGFDIRPILSPTVPKGEERLRICIHCFNTIEEINQLVVKLNALLT